MMFAKSLISRYLLYYLRIHDGGRFILPKIMNFYRLFYTSLYVCLCLTCTD